LSLDAHADSAKQFVGIGHNRKIIADTDAGEKELIGRLCTLLRVVERPLEKLDLSRPLEGNVLCLEFWVLSSRHGHFPPFNRERRLGDGFELSKAPHDFSAKLFTEEFPFHAVDGIHVAASTREKQRGHLIAQVLLDVLLNIAGIIRRDGKVAGIGGVTGEVIHDGLVSSIFANHVSIALEMARMHEDLRKAKGVQEAYHRKMEEIVTQVQNLSLQDRQSLEEHIVILQETPETDGDEILQGQTGDKIPWVRGDIFLLQNSGVDQAEEAKVSVQVEFRDDYWRPTENLNQGKEGAFIQIADPLELGDQFPMVLYMPNGGETIEVQCKVTWTNKYGKETKDLCKGMGIKFLNLKPESKKKIEECVEFQMKNFEIKGSVN
jgi:Tfp pilus assembly protein PilZ